MGGCTMVAAERERMAGLGNTGSRLIQLAKEVDKNFEEYTLQFSLELAPAAASHLFQNPKLIKFIKEITPLMPTPALLKKYSHSLKLGRSLGSVLVGFDLFRGAFPKEVVEDFEDTLAAISEKHKCASFASEYSENILTIQIFWD